MTKIKAFFGKFKKLDIYNNGKIFAIVPLAIILIMIICGLTYQFTARNSFANIGVDFKGGTMLTVEYSGADGMNTGSAYSKNLSIIESALNEKGFSYSVAQSSGESAIIVKYINTAVVDGQAIDYSVDEKVEEMNEINNIIIDNIANKVTAEYGENVTANSTATVIGNAASVKLLRVALISVAVSLAIILIYIIIRFDFYSGLAAVIAVTHDLVIMMALTVIFYIEISSTIVAAIITIVGYSINNTIVIFDKVRSTMKPYKASGAKFDIAIVINKSIFATLTRTLYTTLTTITTIVLIIILGVASVQNFALPILFGLIAGFYSSVLLASPLWGGLKRLGTKIKNERNNKDFKNKGERNNITKMKTKKA
ncbi:MAG TPA: protein translocase subunit SecF [Clostridia bacterium]|nr:protein translocase subunit SecF [Clostridia bacterium]